MNVSISRQSDAGLRAERVGVKRFVSGNAVDD